MNILEMSDVSYLYGKGTPFEKQALSHVSVSFEAEKIIGVIGHTGSGKSTLVQLLNGILKPTEGQVLFNGIDINQKTSERFAQELKEQRENKKVDKKELRRKIEQQQRSLRFHIGLVMQYPEYQLFDETVLSDIGYGPRNMGMDAEQVEACSREAAEMVGLRAEMFDRSPFDLSGGEKRRVAIAGVLSMHPDVLILDEPAAGLDPVGKKTIFDGITRYNRDTGSTVILVSHSMEDLAQYCDEVLVMNQGKVWKSGTVEEIFSNPVELAQLGLDVPQVAYIAQRLREKGIPLSGNLYTVDGLESALLSYMRGGRAQ